MNIPIYPLYSEQHFNFLWWKTHQQAYNTTSPHRHHYHEIVVFFKGGGIHEIDFIHYPIRDCSLHFVRCGQVHHVARAPESLGCSLLFKNEFIHRFPPRGQQLVEQLFYSSPTEQTPVLNFDGTQFEAIAAILEQIHGETEQPKNDQPDLFATYLYAILLQAKRHYATLPIQEDVFMTHKGNDVVFQFQGLLEKYAQEHRKLSDYAQKIQVSVDYLNEQCKITLDKTARQLLQERTLLEAKRLLAYSSQSVKEIAYILSFDDPSYFNRFFKKHTGKTPNEFRESIQ